VIAALLMLLLASARAQDPQPAEPAPVEPAPGEPAPGEPAPLTEGPALLDFVEAPYPQAALERGVEGEVRLRIEIDAEGAVTRVVIEEEPVFPGEAGPEVVGFGEAAALAAQGWSFSPARDESGPVPVAIEFLYRFALPEPEPPADPSSLPAQIEGQLLEMGTRRPLSGFPVVAVDPLGATVEVLTDSEGRFRVAGLSAGTVQVRATYPGFNRADELVQLVEGQAAPALRIWLRNLSYRDDEIVGVYRLPVAAIAQHSVSTDEVRSIPGTFGDPIRVIQNLPGAARAPLGTGLLVIRGANPEDSAVYVDGIRVPLIYHLGGYRSILNADLVESIDYLPGSYGVEYGRSMGGVVDVKTKTRYPERRRIVWNTDILDTSALFEGRVGKGQKVGVALAGRRSYVDVFIPLFTGGSGFTVKPRWYDYQAKVQALDLPKGELSAFLFGFEDVLRVSTPSSFAQGTDADTQGDIGTRYGTHRGMVTWRHPFSDKAELLLVPSFGIDEAEFNLGEAFDLLQQQWLVELRSELRYKPTTAVELLGGVDLIAGTYRFRTRFPFDPTSFADYDPLAEREPFEQLGEGAAWGPDLYLEATLRPLKDRERLSIHPGIRANMVNIVDQLAIVGFDPRIRGKARLVPGGTFKFGSGIYNQPPQPFESWRPGGGVEASFEWAWANEVGWEQQLTEGLNADVAFFHKTLQDQIVSNPALTGIDDQFFLNEGIGRAYGMELIVRQAPVGRLFGWVSYTLSKAVRNDYPERTGSAPAGPFGPFPEDEGWYRFDFDQTHILVGVVGYRLPYDLELSGKAQYVTGNPFTPYAGGVYDLDLDSYQAYSTGALNSERLPPYYKVDLRASRLFTFKSWQLELYLDLLNVVRGVNPEFVQYNYDYTESRYIRGLPFIPSPGFQARFEF